MQKTLAKAGETCPSCYSMWVHQKLEPKTLQQVFDSKGKPMLTDHGIPIVACPFCDSELLFTLPKDVINDDRQGNSE